MPLIKFYIMEARSLNRAQIEILDALASLHTDEEVEALKLAISQFFAKRAQDALEELWQKGEWNQELLDSFENAHYRTPYRPTK